jgi:hypothetical protein
MSTKLHTMQTYLCGVEELLHAFLASVRFLSRPRTHCVRGCVGPKADLGTDVRRKNPALLAIKSGLPLCNVDTIV